MTNANHEVPVGGSGRDHTRGATAQLSAPRTRLLRPATAAGARARVLIVDDEREIHQDFEDLLGRPVGSESDDLAAMFVADERAEPSPDYELQHATNGEQAYELIVAGRRRNEPIAVAYVDVRMPPGIDGVETVRRIRTVDRDVEIVIMTAYADKPLQDIVHDMELLHKLLYIRSRSRVRKCSRSRGR